MTERPITFPKTGEGVWTNSETGVKIERQATGGYRAFRPADVTTGYLGVCKAVKTLAEARHAATRYVADRARPEIARAYVEAVAMHIELAADAAILVGAPTWRADAARRGLQYAVEARANGWLASAINEVRRLEEWTAHYVETQVKVTPQRIAEAYDAAAAEDAERLVAKDGADALVHYWTGYTDVPSACGVDIATTPYTFGSPEWSEVTCKPCEATKPGDAEADTYPRLCEEPTRAPFVESAHTEALAEHRRRYGISVGDAVVLADPDDTGIDTDAVWHVSAVHAVGTTRAYADLTGFSYPEMRSAAYFDRLAPAPRCTKPDAWLGRHGFEHDARVAVGLSAGGSGGWRAHCGKLRSDEVHNTDRERAARTIHAARDHEGAATGTPYGGEWPGTTVIAPYTHPAEAGPIIVTEVTDGVTTLDLTGMAKVVTAGDTVEIRYSEDPFVQRLITAVQRSGKTLDERLSARAASADVRDDEAWAEYAAALPAPTPEAMAEVAVEMSTWTAQRRAAVEAFRSAARSLWSLRAEGLALPGSSEYARLRESMRCFREITEVCDRQNEALRRELLTAGSL